MKRRMTFVQRNKQSTRGVLDIGICNIRLLHTTLGAKDGNNTIKGPSSGNGVIFKRASSSALISPQDQ
jgi:hypothetical protein